MAPAAEPNCSSKNLGWSKGEEEDLATGGARASIRQAERESEREARERGGRERDERETIGYEPFDRVTSIPGIYDTRNRWYPVFMIPGLYDTRFL